MSKKAVLILLIPVLVTMACLGTAFGRSLDDEAQDTGLEQGIRTQVFEVLESAVEEGGVAEVEIFSPYKSFAELPVPSYAPKENYHALGEEVADGDMTWIVLGWTIKEFSIEVADYSEKTVYVDLLLVNRGNTEIWVENRFWLKDDHGEDTAGFSARRLGSGERIRLWLTFTLYDKGHQPQTLYLEPEEEGIPSTRLLWDLGPAPAAVNAPTPFAEERAQNTNPLGTPARLGPLDVTVTSVSYPPPDRDSYPGTKYITVDLILENLSSNDADISFIYGFPWLKDAGGYYYSPILGKDIGDGTIFPGEKMVTQATFEVFEEASGLVFEFDGSYLGWGREFFDLE